MSIASLEGLETKLSKELAWRKKELTDFRMAVAATNKDANHLCCAGLVLACAHWEGFLRRSVELYIQHVFAKKLKIRDLTPVFVSLAYYADVRKAADANFPGSEETHIKLAERIRLGTDEICETPGWTAKTEGNPGSDVIAKLLSSVGLDAQIGFDEAAWSATRIFINEQIVADRNSIAHGEGLPISHEAFLVRTERLLELFDRLAEQLLIAAQNEAYRAEPLQANQQIQGNATGGTISEATLS